jgi:hypothetical protein
MHRLGKVQLIAVFGKADGGCLDHMPSLTSEDVPVEDNELLVLKEKPAA